MQRRRARLNSAYASLAAVEHLQLARRLVMISTEMIEDVTGLWSDIANGCWEPMVVSPSFQVPGLQGASSNASGSVKKGWGAHAFGACAHGRWDPRTWRLIEQRRLSINAPELLAAAAAVVLVDEAGRTPLRGLFALKCDNSTACAAANYGEATSVAMKEALRI